MDAGPVECAGLMATTSLADQYAQACATPSDIYEHLPTFVELCQELDARKVIELGTRGGVSTVAWLYGLHSQGHLWSVDIDPAPPMEFDGWTFIQGDDLDRQVVRSLPNGVDIVFIDTSHMYAQTVAELNVYRWKVRAGGRIVLHDTELQRPEGWTRAQPEFPVKTAVQEFCAEEDLKVTFHPNCWGIAIVEVP